MARITHGTPKADKSLKGPHIDWTGHPVRDGRGYFGDGETDIPAPKAGAFPPKLADISRLRQSPTEALREQIAGVTPTTVTTQRIVEGRTEDEIGIQSEIGKPWVEKKPRKVNPLKEFWARLRADPAAMEAFLAKKKSGFEAWRAKRKAK